MTETTKETVEETEAVEQAAVSDDPVDPIDPDAPEYQLRVSPDKLAVLLDCPDPHANLSTTILRMATDLQELGIPDPPDQEQLQMILTESCPAGSHLQEFVLLSGKPPVLPVDGRLEWSREFFAPGWVINENTGSINFREKLEDRSVSKDELIVGLFPEQEGEPGLDVFGNKISIDKPKRERMRCGKGARQEDTEDGVSSFYSTFDGRVRYTDGTVSVDEVYLIKGDVDLETGNIRHTGSLMIEGDVKAGAVIETVGDVVVKGMVEPSSIVCGGSLTVAGGLLGSPDHLIVLGGGLQAKYVSEAVIRAEDDIIVANEIDHSDIKTRGKVLVQGGRIAGGCTMARQGIQVAEAGSSGSSDTFFVAGWDHALTDKVSDHKIREQKLELALEKIRQALKAADFRRDELSAKEQQVIAQLREKSQVLERALAAEVKTIKMITNIALAGAVQEVVILREIWSGTTIQLGKVKTTVRASVHKPRIARVSKHKVRILPLGEGNMPKD